MKRFVFLCTLCVFCTVLSVFSQDVIINNDGWEIKCRITGLDSVNIYYNFYKNDKIFSAYVPKEQVREYHYGTTSFLTNRDATIRLAGNELVKYSTLYYSGLGLISGGYIVAMVGIISEKNAVTTIGGMMIITGSALQLVSHLHIGYAGKYLRKLPMSDNLQVGATSNGYGLTYCFKHKY